MERRQKSNDAQGVIDQWAALYEQNIPPLLGEGEKSAANIARENHIDHKTAQRHIAEWLKAGIIESVGVRRIGKGVAVEAYKVCVLSTKT